MRNKSIKSPAAGRRLKRLVGRRGTFKDAVGVERACLVTGTDIPPWDDALLVIDYVRDGLKITGAMIPKECFTPDRAAWHRQQKQNRHIEETANARY